MAEKYIETQNPIYPIKVSDKVASLVVDEFCSICDRYKKGTPCSNGDFDQKRYALRNLCGWGLFEGRGSSITLDTIKVNGISYSRANRSKLIEAIKANEAASISSKPASTVSSASAG